MVFLKRSAPEFNVSAYNFPVVEAERERGAINKQSRLSINHENVFDIPPSQYNPLDEPSPLGLSLRKSPSLLDLIQTRLSQANGSSSASTVPSLTPKLEEKKSVKDNMCSETRKKQKASNFPAFLLRIGDWEFLSRFDGDLVAKCYFSKHKLVWEILRNGLKSKIEIQWADIKSLKANLPSDGPGTLFITLGKPPHFFKEIDPQPRKHTLWQSSSDFTDGKASVFRQHILQCPPGVLNKQYEKLIQCDACLNLVSQQPDVPNQSPYFDDRVPFSKNPNAPMVQKLDQSDTPKRSPVSALQDVSSSSSSVYFEEQSYVGLTPEYVSPEAPSPSSVMDLHGSEINSSQREAGYQPQGNWEQLNALGIHKSMSKSDLVSQTGHCMSERMTNGNSSSSIEALEREDFLDNITDFLLSDTPLVSNSDEKQIMSRVNSLCCLLQDPGVGPSSDTGTQFEGLVESENQQMGMSRNDSFSDLLLSLPRISSLPKFLFDIPEDVNNLSK